jgi:hypothetical protein
MEIIINETQDLLTVAMILVKNGYTVRQWKRKKANSTRAYDKVLIVTREGDAK